MPITLLEGLSDTSKELGETTTNSTTRRIQHYGDAVIDFANERKWKFLLKKNTDMSSVVGTQSYAIHANILADWRTPGAIKEITIGDSTDAIKPIDWEDRGDPRFDNGNYFYINPEETTIYFKKAIDQAATINVYYFYIPARTDDLETPGTYPIPSRYRKAIGLLAASNVQFARYLDQQGSRLFNLYTKQLKSIVQQQSEQHTFKPRSLPHFLQYRGGISFRNRRSR